MSYRRTIDGLTQHGQRVVRMSATWKLLLVGIPLLFLTLFFGLAVSIIFVFSFWRTQQFDLYIDWNVNNYITVLTTQSYYILISRSVGIALLVTFICLVIGYPIAYYIARGLDEAQLPVLLLFAAPFFVGAMLRESAHQALIGPSGLINQLLSQVGVGALGIFGYSLLQVLIGEIYLWFPFMMLSIYLSLMQLDFDLIDAAIESGATQYVAFREVTWPLSLPGVAIGSILVFVSTLVSHIPARFVGGPDGTMIGNVLKNLFGQAGAWAEGAALGVLLLTIALVFVILVVSYTLSRLPTLMVSESE